MTYRLILALALTAGAAAPAAAQATFRQLAGYTDVRGGIGSEAAGPTDSDVANSYPAGPVAASSTFGDTVGTASFLASATAGGTLVDASRGALAFTASASAINRPGDPGVVGRAIANTVYLFDVGALSRLNLDFLLSVAGDTPAAYLLLTERDAGNNVTRTLFSRSNYRTSDALAFDLTAGTYQLRFGNNVGNAVSFANPGVDADSITGTLNFAITDAAAGAVPEPGSWAMMMLGFGAAGGALRRRRTTVAFA